MSYIFIYNAVRNQNQLNEMSFWSLRFEVQLQCGNCVALGESSNHSLQTTDLPTTKLQLKHEKCSSCHPHHINRRAMCHITIYLVFEGDKH